MDIFLLSTIILAIWGALGPLVGVRYGQDLARRWQKEQWIRENKRQEAKELLAVIYEQLPVKFPNKEQELTEFKLTQTFNNRVFIACDLQKLKTQERWRELRNDVRYQKIQSEEYLKRREELTSEIRELALG